MVSITLESTSDAFANRLPNRPNAWHSLLWKDAKLASSVLLAGIAASVAFYLLLSLFRQFAWSPSEQSTSQVVGFALWILMPNLVALGLPPMLIGGENDERTFDWLRTLPATWWQVLVSKVVMAIGVWAIVLAFSSLLYMLAGGLSATIATGTNTQDLSLTNWRNWAGLIGYGLMLLMVGFLASTLARSPVASILMVFPMMIGVILVADWLLQPTPSSPPTTARLVLVGTSLILAVSGGVSWLARRQLTVPIRRRYGFPRTTRTAFAPRSVDDVSYRPRPSPMRALLWQSLRQGRWFMIGWVATTTLVLGSMTSLTLSSVNAPIPLIWLCFVQSLLGAWTFHADSHPSHVGFCYQRGISRSKVWFTRILPCLCLSVVIALATAGWAWLVWGWVLGRDVAIAVLIGHVIIFMMGVASSLWVKRRSLAFFAASALATIWSGAIVQFLVRFPSYTWALWVPSLVWGFATWRMTRFWMRGEFGFAVSARWFGYAMLSLGGFFAVSIGHRYASIPDTMVQWRDKARADRLAMLQSVDVEPTSDAVQLIPPRPGASTRLSSRAGLLASAGPDQIDRLQSRLDDALSERNVVGTVPISDLARVISSIDLRRPAGTSEAKWNRLRQSAIELALRWSSLARTEIVLGNAGLRALLGLAEPVERVAVVGLTSLMNDRGQATQANWLDDQQLIAWIDALPSDTLRQQSRRAAILRDWQQFDERCSSASHVWTSSDEAFGLASMSNGQLTLNSLERLRTRNNLDVAVRQSLAALAAPNPSFGSIEFHRIRILWVRATQLQDDVPTGLLTPLDEVDDFDCDWKRFPIFIAEHQMEIDRLRALRESTWRSIRITLPIEIWTDGDHLSRMPVTWDSTGVEPLYRKLN
ncbi:MAG: ABC transporter permease [Planctomycetota bacterium]